MKYKDRGMTPPEIPKNLHQDIPSNPSTAVSSTKKLNDRTNNIPLRVLSEVDWDFWRYNGYIVIKNAVGRR